MQERNKNEAVTEDFFFLKGENKNGELPFQIFGTSISDWGFSPRQTVPSAASLLVTSVMKLF
jgi:hypothetical protein